MVVKIALNEKCVISKAVTLIKNPTDFEGKFSIGILYGIVLDFSGNGTKMQCRSAFKVIT